MKIDKFLILSSLVIGCLFSLPSFAVDIDLPGVNVDFGGEQQDYTDSIKIFALLTVLSLAPAILIVLTSFTRIVIVLAMLRHAMGMPSTPPNSVLISLALFLTFFSMQPVYEDMKNNAYDPYTTQAISADEALDVAQRSLEKFMVSQTRETDIALMYELSKKTPPSTINDIDFAVLVPAFMLSELQTAFQIGSIIFLPFLAVDLIVASVLMSMGMIMLPPMTISLPIKILMFVLIEGWALVAHSLLGSFMP